MSRPGCGSEGFTLIELLVVMVVIGVLAAIAIPRYSETRRKALESTVASDLKGLAASQEIYHLNNNAYGGTLAMVDAETSEGVVITINEASASGWSAVGAHPGVGSGQCAFFFGDASPVDPATTPGVVACDF